MTAKQKTLRLVADQSSTDGDRTPCNACDLKRQLEHVKMLLNAALLAVADAKPPKNPGTE